jgi:hypothetical protein
MLATSMAPAWIALNSAVSEVNGTPWNLDIFAACGPPYLVLGTMVNAPVIALKADSL